MGGLPAPLPLSRLTERSSVPAKLKKDVLSPGWREVLCLQRTNRAQPPGLLWIITSFILLTLSPGELSSQTGLNVWPHGLANTKIHITAARLQDSERMPARGSHPGTPAAPPSPCQMPALSFLSLPLLIPTAGREVLQQRHQVNLVKRVTPCLCPTSSLWDAGTTGKGSKVAPCKSNASQQIHRSQGQSTSRFK